MTGQTVADVVGMTLARLGADCVFGVVGSGNFHVTNALVAQGARFVATRHECGAATAADALRSNFRVDQDALARAVGAVSDRVHGADSAVADTARAWHLAVGERRTVVLNLPLDVQAA